MTAPLAQAHRLVQVRLGARAVAGMRAVWPLLDPEDLDGTFARWLVAATAIIRSQRVQSARLAANFLLAAKRQQLGAGATPVTVLAEAVNQRIVTTSLLVTGPVSIKRAQIRGVRLDQSVDVAEAASAAAGMRHALNGGRDTITRSLKADRDGAGYRRVASGNACTYCSDLEGIEFDTDEVFSAHDGCSCSSEPVFRR